MVGGGQIYTEALPSASVAVITEVDPAPATDTFVPRLDCAAWAAEDEEPTRQTSRTGMRYRTLTYHRV